MAQNKKIYFDNYVIKIDVEIIHTTFTTPTATTPTATTPTPKCHVNQYTRFEYKPGNEANKIKNAKILITGNLLNFSQMDDYYLS